MVLESVTWHWRAGLMSEYQQNLTISQRYSQKSNINLPKLSKGVFFYIFHNMKCSKLLLHLNIRQYNYSSLFYFRLYFILDFILFLFLKAERKT